MPFEQRGPLLSGLDAPVQRALVDMSRRRLTNNGADFTDDVSIDGDVEAADGTFSGDLTATTVNGWTVGQWTTFTPMWSGFTPGTATLQRSYCYVPGGMRVKMRAILSASSSVTGHIKMVLPNGETSSNVGGYDIGTGYYGDANGPDSVLLPICGSNSTTIDLYVSSSLAQVNATSPFTWTTNDSFLFDITVAL